MTSQQAGEGYPLGLTEAEIQRLIRQHQLYGPATRRLLEEAGVGAGMRVLDVGSGAGDVALLVAELVGPTGSVIGVEVNPAAVETARARVASAGLANVAFVAGDFRNVVLDGMFDAIVGRLVLAYVADPAEALRGLVARLKPNGVMAFQEFEFGLALAYADSELCPAQGRQYWYWTADALRRAGIHLSMGFGLHAAFVRAGLPAPEMSVFAPLGGSDDWVGYELGAEGQRSMLSLYERYGIATAAEVGVETLAERTRAHVLASGQPAMLTPHVCAWARKWPAEAGE